MKKKLILIILVILVFAVSALVAYRINAPISEQIEQLPEEAFATSSVGETELMSTPEPTPEPAPDPTPDPMQYYFDGASDEIILSKSTISEYNDDFLYGTYYDLEYNLEKVYYYVPYEINDDTAVTIFVPGSSNLPKYADEIQYIKTHEVNSIVIYRFSGSLTSMKKNCDNFIKMVNDIRYTYGIKRTDISAIGFSLGGEFALGLIQALNHRFPEAASCKLVLLDVTLVCNGGQGRFLREDEIADLKENDTLVLCFEPKMNSKTKFHDFFPQSDIDTYLILRSGTHRQISVNAFKYDLVPWLLGAQGKLTDVDEPYIYYEFDLAENQWIETDGTQIIKPVLQPYDN